MKMCRIRGRAARGSLSLHLPTFRDTFLCVKMIMVYRLSITSLGLLDKNNDDDDAINHLNQNSTESTSPGIS